MNERSGKDAGNKIRKVAVVGAGFGGVGAAIRLKQQGLYDFVVFDRAAEVGGVWQANDYPGAACDVPSHLYSFSFAPGFHWSRRFAPQAEIRAYLKELVQRYELGAHFRLNTEIKSARYDGDNACWVLATANGESESFDALITACGQLTNPATPDLPGSAEFGGPCFHSARWDHEVPLEGKKLAVIGTGASAIQFVPRVAEQAAQVDIYQRTPGWIIPKFDRSYSSLDRWMFRHVPGRIAFSRKLICDLFDWLALAFVGNERVNRLATRWSNWYRNRSLKGRPDLIEKTTPKYKLGCKRIMLTNQWYPTLKRDNVALHSGGKLEIKSDAVVGPDGIEREADVIIWGTGFEAGDFVAPMKIHGSDGRELCEVWGDRPEAYLGITMNGFPNLFLIYGPNTNHGSGSVPDVEECQLQYITDALKKLHDGGHRSIELKAEVQQQWREEIERRSQGTVWLNGGCKSWYLNAESLNTHNWPASIPEYRQRARSLSLDDYQMA